MMGLFDLFKTKKDELSWEDENTYKGATPNCPNCGTPLTKRYVFSEMYCENCRYGLDDIPNDMEDESIDVCDAALIWQSNGKDEDYTFGYSEAELEAALR
ncbi:hypothetical protein HCZ01_08765 [Limosilactobacillus fermentum]|nr:hypothetical protein B5C32_09575 [Limosilactobacillus fermentum]MBC9022954.1 hypothetical protein [Limosilactobacillus fermentum CECT 5716]MCB4716582.1 hypothetical protein [Limosilactobacillus fermentum]QSE66729.1 hypothetical protein JWS00_03970 [Limosilactobacillus fermentum]QSH34866.1 hypothetical protein JYQ66_03920 [Limosilactobacillus fermentum]